VTNEWDAAASDYAANWEKTTGYTVERLVDWVALHDGATVADVACGPGTVTVALLARGARVAASDFSPGMIDALRARVGEDAGVEAEVADAAALPYGDDTMDGAVSNFGVIFCPQIDDALRELTRVTKPAGRLAMTAWTTEARNGWTTLLDEDRGASLEFPLPERPAYRWANALDFARTLERAGWRELTIDTVDFPPHMLPSADHAGEALNSPATRLALQSMPQAHIAALAAHLVERARTLYGEGEVPLPRQAWLARGVA
jgi:SAM-dependent methyltransferase